MPDRFLNGVVPNLVPDTNYHAIKSSTNYLRTNLPRPAKNHWYGIILLEGGEEEYIITKEFAKNLSCVRIEGNVRVTFEKPYFGYVEFANYNLGVICKNIKKWVEFVGCEDLQPSENKFEQLKFESCSTDYSQWKPTFWISTKV